MDLKENSGQTEYGQLLLVQQKKGIQQSRKATNVKTVRGNTLLHNIEFPLQQGALQATEGVR